jgi:predicted ATPase
VLAATFIGRTDDVDILRKSVLSGRLVTLLGSAGTGKTSLALKVCASLNSAFMDGVWYAELASIATPDLVVLSVMTSLKVHEDSDLTADKSLADAIGPRSLLLVWDNCEHVAAECARLAALLL